MATVGFPVTFIVQGKTIHGILEQPLGAGDNCWHLNVEGWHWGRIYRPTPPGTEWRFVWNRAGLEELNDYFMDVITAWYQ